MNSRNLCAFIFTSCLVLLIFHSSTDVKDILTTTRNKNVLRSDNNYLIDGIDRFDWYKKVWEKRKRPDHPKYKKPVRNASLFYAYEYDFEISVSITTPRDVTPTGSILYCRYFDEHNVEILPAFESISHPYFTINCQKRNGVRRISLSTTVNGSYDDPIPLINRMNKEMKYEFSMCLCPLYGSEPKWLQIAELIEHYKLHGVQHFYVYIHNLSIYDSHILNDYARTGEVEVHYLLEKYKREDKEWQMVMIRDCTLRTRSESKWTIFADIDERLIMTSYSGTILDFLRNLKPKYAGIQFRQRWIMKTELMPEKYEGDTQIEKWMPTLRWHNSTGVARPGHTTKNVIDTNKVYSMWVHSPSVLYPGYEMYYLKPEEGIVRHYRDQSMGDWGKHWLKSLLIYGNMTMTEYPEKYMKQLTENVKKRISEVYSNYKNY